MTTLLLAKIVVFFQNEKLGLVFEVKVTSKSIADVEMVKLALANKAVPISVQRIKKFLRSFSFVQRLILPHVFGQISHELREFVFSQLPVLVLVVLVKVCGDCLLQLLLRVLLRRCFSFYSRMMAIVYLNNAIILFLFSDRSLVGTGAHFQFSPLLFYIIIVKCEKQRINKLTKVTLKQRYTILYQSHSFFISILWLFHKKIIISTRTQYYRRGLKTIVKFLAISGLLGTESTSRANMMLFYQFLVEEKLSLFLLSNLF